MSFWLPVRFTVISVSSLFGLWCTFGYGMSLFRDALDRRCRALTEVIHATYIRAHSVSLDILRGAGADRARCLQLSALFSLCVHAFSCSVLTMVVNAAVAGIALVAATAQPAS